MKTCVLASLSFWLLCLVPSASKLVRGSRGGNRRQRRVQELTEFVSFFDIGYTTNSTGEVDLTLAAEALNNTYNNKLMPTFSNDFSDAGFSYDDPFQRRMVKVEVVNVTSFRKLSEGDSRSLQFSSQLRNLNVRLRVTGTCVGCSSLSRFTNQVQRRYLSRRRAQGKGGKNTDTGDDDDTSDEETMPPEDGGIAPPNAGTPPPNAGTTPPVPGTIPPVTGTMQPMPETTPPAAGTTQPMPETTPPAAGTMQPMPETTPPATGTMPPATNSSLPMVPTEEELRLAYVKEVKRWEPEIIDVPTLDEIGIPEIRSIDSTPSESSSVMAAYCTRSIGDIYHCP